MIVMKRLLDMKVKTCEAFRNVLLENQDKILAESTPNFRWGTGMSQYVTEHTRALNIGQGRITLE